MAYFAKNLLAKWTRGEWINPTSNTNIQGFSIDSRNIEASEMFVALRSEKRDGHAYVIDAARKGATAALTEEWVGQVEIPQLKVKQGVNALQLMAKNHRMLFSGPVVGITGSAGKTSTKEMIALLLGQKRVLKTSGNLNNHLGVPLTLLRLDSDKHDFGVIEAGINQRGEMSVLGDVIDADFGVVTMIGRAHLELLQDLETVAREKAELLKNGRQKEGIFYPAACLKYASFQNITDSTNHVLTPLGMQLPTLDWLHPHHYWCFRSEDGIWTLHIRGKNGIERRFVIPNLSSGMRQNLALAIITVGQMGVSDEDIQKRILQWKPANNRGEIYKTTQGWIYSDCYNANPDSMIDSLGAFESSFSADTPKLYVLGSMFELGEDSESYHREVAAKIHFKAGDKLVCVGEHAHAYAQGLKYADASKQDVFEFENGEDAREIVEGFSGAVFLKGSRKNKLEALIPHGSTKIVLETGKLC